MNVTSVLLDVTAMHICTVAKDGDIDLFVNLSDILPEDECCLLNNVTFHNFDCGN